MVGFISVIGQIVLIRELIVVFSGNEMSLGILLSTWLFWTAAGSWASSRLRLGRGEPRSTAAAFECVSGVSLLPTVWILRDSRSIFQSVPGELVGPLPMLLTSLACLSVFCAASGALFVVAARLYESELRVPGREAAGSAYMLEAAGSAIGGLAASIVLLRYFDSFQIASIVALMNLCMASVLWLRMRRGQAIVLAGAAALLAIPLLVVVAPALNRSAQTRLWRGFHLMGSRDTIYGNLAVTETDNTRSLYENGVILANSPDENAAEEAVHYALLEHPAPRTVLMIGGGISGGVGEALKHLTIERIDYVELDPALIGMARQFFPTESAALNADPRVKVHYADGRRYLKTAGRLFDVIILDVPDPQTAQLNRYYTAEFFRSAREHLAPGGVLALELRSSEETINPDLAAFLRCMQRTLSEEFPYTAFIPGDTMHMFGAGRAGVLTEDPRVLIRRLEERRLATKYVREYFIPYRMMPDRMAQVGEQLRPIASTPVNRDFDPIAYYFSVALWSSQFKAGYAGWFRAAAEMPFSWVMAGALVMLALAAVLAVFAPPRGRRAAWSAAFCMGTAGFTLMALQILLLMAFQSIYGYVYHQLAILIGLCMGGIAFGSWLGMRHRRLTADSTRGSLAIAQFLMALSAPVLMIVVGLLDKASGTPATWMAAELVFPALAAMSGMLGGYQFAVAAEVYLDGREGGGGLGVLYGIDLLGGCMGALLLSSYLIPVFGFWRTAWLCAAINLAPAVLAVLGVVA